MGEVYKARDSRLDRVVALKVISPLLAESAELRQRFEREARTISQLTHPNICALYDVGEARPEGAPAATAVVRYLVLEYCQGQTLAEKLQKGPLPVDQALRIAIDICSALQRAHAAGIIHRDLKPANIMLTMTGAKLLDFGLARPSAFLPNAPAVSTIPSPLTERGTILGTFQYMAPEQVEGEEADVRSDIWALGCVIYEMITGKRAFAGKSQSSVIAAILEREPQPLMAGHPEVPPILDAVVRACLAKAPADRIQSAHDVGLQLRWIADDAVATPSGSTAPARRSRAWIVAGAAAAVALALAVPGYRYLAAPSIPLPRAVVVSIAPPEGLVFSPVDGFSVSNEGTAVAFTATAENGERSLWVRRFDSTTPARIAAVRNPLLPFWSSDDSSIGVFAGGFLQVVSLAAGTSRPLLAASPGSATWSAEGLIVYSVDESGLHVVGADGSGARALTKVDKAAGEGAHVQPLFIPDTDYIAFSVLPGVGLATRAEPEIRAVSLSSGEIRPLNVKGRLVGFDEGLLLHVTPDGSLRALPWDADKMSPAGPDRLLRPSDPAAPGADVRFAVSAADVLAYRGGTNRARHQLTWFDRNGTKLGTLGEIDSYSNPAISPDGRRVAVGVRTASESRDIWVFDVARNTPTRLTHHRADDFSPVWSPDGSRVAFSSDRNGVRDIYVTPSSGLGPDELLVKSDAAKNAEGWSADGRYLVFSLPGNQQDVAALLLPERKVAKLLEAPYAEFNAAISPDGTLLAYMSNENGADEVFIQRFPDTSRKWQISKAGGAEPQWRKDGRELYYLAQDDLMAVSLAKGRNGLEPQEPRRLFRQRLGPFLRNRYVVAPDGQRFLLNVPATDRTVEPITVILNWQQLPQ